MTGPRSQTFWDKVDQTGDCWLWMGSRDSNGYGLRCFQGVRQLAHRAAYEMVKGPIPDGLCKVAA
jgi:hypothetical protein